jgi:serine/threonine-protein kinase
MESPTPAFDEHDPDQTAPPFALRLLTERYELLGELGRGGMAVVYHGRERPLAGSAAGDDAPAGREVAIKVVSSRYAGDVDAVRRFAREARTVAGLDHPNIVCTLAIEELAGDAVAIVQEYVRGRTLRVALREAGGPLPYAVAADVLRNLASALAYAHARRIVHRDVKPENVFLAEGGAHPRALLADFGIARPLDADSALTVDGAALGTPTYMAPEQIVGRPVDERTDVYALALVGWEMLAGRRPWQGETLYSVLHKQQHEQLPDLAALRPDIPAYLLDAVRGGLAKNPAGRWRDGADFLERLTPAPASLPALPDDADLDADTAPPLVSDTVRVVPGDVAWGPPPEAAGPNGLPEPTRRRAVGRPRATVGRWVAAVGVAAALAAGALAWRGRTSAAPPPSDAAVTGVTDAELDSLLRDAAAAAGRPARRAAPPAGGRAPASVAPGAVRPPGTPVPPVRRAAPTSAVPPPAAGDRGVAGPGPPLTTVTSERAAPATPPAALPADAGAEPGTASGPEDTDPRGSLVATRTTASTDPRCGSAANADQQACLMSELERNDAGLTRSYRGLIAELRRRAGGALEPPTVEALRVEQRAWVDARDRQCRARLAGREGPLWGAARAPCFAALSDRRARDLDARLARLTGTPPP